VDADHSYKYQVHVFYWRGNAAERLYQSVYYLFSILKHFIGFSPLIGERPVGLGLLRVGLRCMGVWCVCWKIVPAYRLYIILTLNLF
jgi:hypothetical protein